MAIKLLLTFRRRCNMFDNTVRKAWICVGIFMHHSVIFSPVHILPNPFSSSSLLSFVFPSVLNLCFSPAASLLEFIFLYCQSTAEAAGLCSCFWGGTLLRIFFIHMDLTICVCVFGFPSTMAGTGWIHMGGMLQHVCLYCRYLPVHV